MKLLTKPGNWFVNRKTYTPWASVEIRDIELCEKDKNILKQQQIKNDIVAFSFLFWIFSVIGVIGIILLILRMVF